MIKYQPLLNIIPPDPNLQVYQHPFPEKNHFFSEIQHEGCRANELNLQLGTTQKKVCIFILILIKVIYIPSTVC